DPGQLPAGASTARVRLTPVTSTVPSDASITLIVTAGQPKLQIAPDSLLKFGARISNPGAQEQIIALRNTGGGGSLSFSAQVAGLSPWLSVTPGAGQIVKDTPALVRVRVN